MPKQKKTVQKLKIESTPETPPDVLKMGDRFGDVILNISSPYDRTFVINFWQKEFEADVIDTIRIDNGGEGLRFQYVEGALAFPPEYNDHIWDSSKGKWEDAQTRFDNGTMKACLADVYSEICKNKEYFINLKNANRELYKSKYTFTQGRRVKRLDERD
jgi:hypothetical protein